MFTLLVTEADGTTLLLNYQTVFVFKQTVDMLSKFTLFNVTLVGKVKIIIIIIVAQFPLIRNAILSGKSLKPVNRHKIINQ